MCVRVFNSMLILLCALLCTTGCYRASPPLEDDSLEQPDAVTDTTQKKPTPTPVAGPATPNNSPLIMQLGDLEIDELSTFPTLAFRIFDFDDEITCQEVIPESSNQNAIQTTTEGEPNESAMTYGDITITGGDSTKCGIAISTRYAAPDPVTISLTLSDGKGATKSYFDVTVLSTNTAPTPDGSGQVNIAMQEDDSGKSILLSEFSDSTPRGSPARLVFESVTNPNKGVLGLYPSDAGTGGQNIIYTPNENENGSDSFSYKVCDNDPGVPKCSAVQTVNISIAAVNDAPVIAPIDPKTTNENESLTFTFAISDVDNTPSCSAMSYTPDSLVSAVTFTGNGNPDCVATISPTQPGSATITFRLFDGEKTGERSFAFNVEGVNEAPTISDITNVTATEDQTFEVSFTAGDADGALACSSDYLSYSSDNFSKVAQTGAVSWSGTWPNCKGTVTPVSNAFGAVDLDFKVTDGEYTATDSFTVTLTNVNDEPSGTVKCNNATTNIVNVGKSNQSWNFNCNNATDPDNETLTYKLMKDSETDLSGVTCAETINSSVVSATEGQFSANFASAPHYGTCTYKVKACDAAGLCTPLSSFHIEITSYQATVSTVNKPTLSAACDASSSATFSFSGNISSITYTAKTGINNESGQSSSTSTSPVNFSYTLPTVFLTTSRLTTDETSNTSASFTVNSGVFKNAIGGGLSISASGTSSSFKVERTLETVSPSFAVDFTTKDVSLDGYQPLFASTPSVCRQCTANRISLSTGTTHTCVTDDNTKLKCWGKNTSSQLGTGNTSEFTYAAESSIDNAFAALQVSTGLDFSCVYGQNSTTPEIRCAGSNSTGQLGRSGSTYNKFDSTSQKVNTPVNHTPVAVAAAKFGEFACGLFNQSTGGTEKGRVYCWGKNNNGQLGNGTTTTPSAGTLVGLAGEQGNSDFFALSAGETHACAIREDSASSSKVYCWGSGSYGQLGNTPSSVSSSTPVKADTTLLGSSVVQVAVGSQHTCALTTGGQVYCWGSGALGQLGLGVSTTSDNSADDCDSADNIVEYCEKTPQHVADSAINGKVVQISAGAHHTCALLNTFELYCWGFGSSGQLGLGSSTTSDGSADDCNGSSGVQNVAYCKKSPQKIEFSGSPKLMSVSAGAEHTCAVALDGQGFCWGRNVDGRLGIATKTDEASPNNICSTSGATCTPLTSLRPRMCSTYSIP